MAKQPFRIIGILAAIFSGCGTMQVRSTPPEAEVGVILPGKESIKVLGKTPFVAEISDLEDMVNEGTIVVVISKQGYLPQNFVVPNLSGKLEIEANLSPNIPGNYQEINNIVALVLSAERALMEKRFDEALNQVKELKKINQNISSAYELEGTALFLQKDLKNSRYAWIRALELNPNNPEARNMLALIERELAKGVEAGGIELRK